ncbi:MAG TPA: tRNA (adenosine(37)-N6)-threonylcarbamoyltransferase complex dimerization subunit type 1 TsaB [Saprospiraceae bacterium]|nr:tRNA (adenosine(37)-N6)-threonylcarbamoyltransferase complex dimerization subunit type 1 TsaB [Saprospiraceae bacterium]
MNTRLLLLETSGEVCSVCISYGNAVVSLQESTESFSHASEVTILIEKALKSANLEMKDLDAVVVSDGPGSYTGLRVGLSVAKGLCFGLDIPLIAVNSLDALAHFAQASHPDALYFPMIDARRMEVYMRGFDADMQAIFPIGAVILSENTFDEWLPYGKKIVLCGSGVEKSKTLYSGEHFVFMDTIFSSKHLVGLGLRAFQQKEFVDLAGHTPFYLKPPNITQAKKK